MLLVLADSHQDRADRRTFPKVATIAADAMMCERQCQRVFASLEHKGVLRREYPAGMGRDRLTYYFFPELDGEKALFPAVNKPAGKRVEKPGKGDKMSPLFPAEGRQKGDTRVTSDAPLLIALNKSNKGNKSKDTPVVPASGDGEGVAFEQAVDRAVDQVCSALDIAENQRRRRRMIASAVKRACEKGDVPPTVALGMIGAVKEQDELFLRGELKFKYGIEKFIGGGIWRDTDRWGWDPKEFWRTANARVGS